MAWPTVWIFSACSSGISVSNSSSSAITSSTVSSESAPRSLTKWALGVTSAASTPSCSTMICLTRSSISAMVSFSSHIPAAVHSENVAGDVRRLVGRQEQDGAGDVDGIAHAAEEDLLDELLARLFGDDVRQAGLDEARRDCVGADAARGELARHRLGERDD